MVVTLLGQVPVDNDYGHDGTQFFAGQKSSSNPGIYPCNFGEGYPCMPEGVESVMSPGEIVGSAPRRPLPPACAFMVESSLLVS